MTLFPPSFIERTNKIIFEVFLWLSIYLASLWFKHNFTFREEKYKIKWISMNNFFLLLVANLIEQVWNWNVSPGKLSTPLLIFYILISCNDCRWLSNNFLWLSGSMLILNTNFFFLKLIWISLKHNRTTINQVYVCLRQGVTL